MVMVDGGDNDDGGGVGVGTELVGAGDVELPTGSTKLSGPWLARRRLGPSWVCSAAVLLSLSSLAHPVSFGALHRGVVVRARW